MKKDFMLKEEIADVFEKLSNDELRAMTLGFLKDYGASKRALGKNVDLHPNNIQLWLDNKEPLGERSLKRIFAYLTENYSRWRDYVGNNGTSASLPTNNI